MTDQVRQLLGRAVRHPQRISDAKAPRFAKRVMERRSVVEGERKLSHG
jgi:hypothetical protein